jgi:hypothetical protein
MATGEWTYEVLKEVSLELPGILEFRIDGIGSYVVMSNRLSRRIRDYESNEKRLREGRLYASGGSGFRRIHQMLHKATKDGRTVTIVACENCSQADLSARRRHWIERVGTLNKPA